MRPIDADGLAKAVKEMVGLETGIGREINEGMTVAYAMIAMAPTLTLDDLRPKGRWDLDDKRRPYCTNCKKVAIQFENKAYYVPGFCYHCGADMRGGGEDA